MLYRHKVERENVMEMVSQMWNLMGKVFYLHIRYCSDQSIAYNRV